MAVFGCCYPRFAPFQGEEPTDAKPTYGTVIGLGTLVSANVTVNIATGELYGDNKIVEKVSEFASGEAAIETDDVSLEDAATIYGATYSEEGGLVDNDGDTPPYGGLAYYKTLQLNGVTTYEGYFYPKVKANLGNDSTSTKGSSITLNSTSITFSIFPPNIGDWRKRKRFTEEADVQSWCNSNFAATPSE